ncbi:MAG: hypothetical protein NC191_01025, partial [Muribaculaceae bacterium]|nr:hypothetical protein [Muribaculaceae bacterium]
ATRTYSTIYNVPTGRSNYNYNYKNINPYTKDLARIEDYLFGKTYMGESAETRLNRIEKELFNKTYPSLNIAQRMNRALENYRDDYYNRNYLSQYYSNSLSPTARIRNRFTGQPTGFTPPIYTSPFGSGFSGINQSFSSNRGYGYNNYIPANTGMGVHILN